ncbi:MAG TPA: hypothetical protein PKC29_12850 [Thermodesulfobacteriota bacterium]|mgnify:FL=1|nr:hypothetical protein [Thermodesulfobacteriota bacterium]
MDNGDSKPLAELFGSDTQGRLIFDLVRAIVADRMKITALEDVIVARGILSREDLDERYKELLSSTSDEVINDVLREFGKVG